MIYASRDGRVKKYMHKQESVGIILDKMHHMQLIFKQQCFHEKACRDASCLFLSLLTLVCVLFHPTIPTYSCNFLVAFYTCLVLYFFPSEQSIQHIQVRSQSLLSQWRCCGVWHDLWAWSLSSIVASPRQQYQVQSNEVTARFLLSLSEFKRL